MKFYLEKTIRVDYYPKTEGDVDQFEEDIIEDKLDKEVKKNTDDEFIYIIKENIKNDDSIAEYIENLEEIEEIEDIKEIEEIKEIEDENIEDTEDIDSVKNLGNFIEKSDELLEEIEEI